MRVTGSGYLSVRSPSSGGVVDNFSVWLRAGRSSGAWRFGVLRMCDGGAGWWTGVHPPIGFEAGGVEVFFDCLQMLVRVAVVVIGEFVFEAFVVEACFVGWFA